MMYVYSYNQGSQGAKGLADALGARRIRHEGSRFRGSSDKKVVNWGSSSVPPEVAKCRVFNYPLSVQACSNKLRFFEIMANAGGISIPEWTTDYGIASGWLIEGHTVVCRHVLGGHSGEGIEIAVRTPNSEVTLPRAPLYTKYEKKSDEYRVHCGQVEETEEVIDTQRKARRRDIPDEQVNWKVRNLQGGFIYARQDLDIPEQVHTEALKAFAATDLDFGAVDVLWNQRTSKATVLEINTAPGLQGTTLEKYRDFFNRWA